VAALSGGEDACAGVVWNGRSERLSDPLTALGLFWNLVPVARPATASRDAAARALAVHQDLLQADRFGRYPLAEIMANRGGREPFFSTCAGELPPSTRGADIHHRRQSATGVVM
ncbi:MAG TPA: hypothetical protein VFQ76_15215, partial [Longimicrobiaceae bacterium]|nr:hypothetical protein [Longimicrobiaceae bacterium]